MNRRDFLGAMLAACAAPAIVRADSLMRIVPPETAILSSYDFAAMWEPTRMALTFGEHVFEAERIYCGSGLAKWAAQVIENEIRALNAKSIWLLRGKA